MRGLCVAALLVMASSAAAEGEGLYELSTSGTTERLKVGERGKWVLEIRAKEGAHVSEEAPLKLELASSAVRLEKEKLGRADAQGGKAPRFEVPFVGSQPGSAQVNAKVTFFICTETLCARQQKQLTVPVEVVGE